MIIAVSHQDVVFRVNKQVVGETMVLRQDLHKVPHSVKELEFMASVMFAHHHVATRQQSYSPGILKLPLTVPQPPKLPNKFPARSEHLDTVVEGVGYEVISNVSVNGNAVGSLELGAAKGLKKFAILVEDLDAIVVAVRDHDLILLPIVDSKAMGGIKFARIRSQGSKFESECAVFVEDLDAVESGISRDDLTLQIAGNGGDALKLAIPFTKGTNLLVRVRVNPFVITHKSDGLQAQRASPEMLSVEKKRNLVLPTLIQTE